MSNHGFRKGMNQDGSSTEGRGSGSKQSPYQLLLLRCSFNGKNLPLRRAIYVLIADREELKSTLSFDLEEYKGYWSDSGS